MGKNQKTSHKLQPKDKFSKFPKTTAFILYRIYPIGSVSLMLYLAHTDIVLDWYQLKKFWIIFIIAALLCFSGMWYGRKYHGSKLEVSGSRQAWLDTINSNIEDWVKGGVLVPISGVYVHLNRTKGPYRTRRRHFRLTWLVQARACHYLTVQENPVFIPRSFLGTYMEAFD
jgi:hypothetical protein